jgi:hypothetical protein
MRWLRRTKDSQCRADRLAGTDIRKISTQVQERRRERARNPEISRQNPEVAEAIVRNYRPESHLRSVDTKTQQLVQDAVDIPRTWDNDPPPVTAPQADEHSVRGYYIVVLCSNVFPATITLIGLFNVSLSEIVFLLLPFAAASLVLLLVASTAYFDRLGHLAWAGLAICIGELGVVVEIIGRSSN